MSGKRSKQLRREMRDYVESGGDEPIPELPTGMRTRHMRRGLDDNTKQRMDELEKPAVGLFRPPKQAEVLPVGKPSTPGSAGRKRRLLGMGLSLVSLVRAPRRSDGPKVSGGPSGLSDGNDGGSP